MKTKWIILLSLFFIVQGIIAQNMFAKRKYTKGFFYERMQSVKHPQSHLLQKNEKVLKEELVSNSVTVMLKEDTIYLAPIDTVKEVRQIMNSVKTVSKVKASCKSSMVKAQNDEEELVMFSANGNKKIGTRATAIAVSGIKTPDDSFASFLFGDAFEFIGIVLIVLAAITLLIAAVYIVMIFHSLWFYVLLGVLLVGTIVYLIASNYAKHHNGKGEKLAAVLEFIGRPIYEILGALLMAVA